MAPTVAAAPGAPAKAAVPRQSLTLHPKCVQTVSRNPLSWRGRASVEVLRRSDEVHRDDFPEEGPILLTPTRNLADVSGGPFLLKGGGGDGVRLLVLGAAEPERREVCSDLRREFCLPRILPTLQNG